MSHDVKFTFKDSIYSYLPGLSHDLEIYIFSLVLILKFYRTFISNWLGINYLISIICQVKKHSMQLKLKKN